MLVVNKGEKDIFFNIPESEILNYNSDPLNEEDVSETALMLSSHRVREILLRHFFNGLQVD